MGAALTKFYEEAKAVGGLKAQMRLAIKSGLPSNKAAEQQDDPNVVAKLKAAWDEVKREF